MLCNVSCSNRYPCIANYVAKYYNCINEHYARLCLSRIILLRLFLGACKKMDTIKFSYCMLLILLCCQYMESTTGSTLSTFCQSQVPFVSVTSNSLGMTASLSQTTSAITPPLSTTLRITLIFTSGNYSL